MKKKATITVKSKPSTIIREQIAALNWAEKRDGLEINMGTWCDLNGDKCELCEAGAWYAKTHGVDDTVKKFDRDHENADATPIMEAMNLFREGFIECAYRELNRNMPEILSFSVSITDYREDKKKHKKDMLKLAAQLEALGE